MVNIIFGSVARNWSNPLPVYILASFNDNCIGFVNQYALHLSLPAQTDSSSFYDFILFHFHLRAFAFNNFRFLFVFIFTMTIFLQLRASNPLMERALNVN